MTMPGWRAWVFAVRSFAAAMTAMYIALLMDLPRPYWAVATAYITSQVHAGATRSKAMYRVGGTIVGAAAAVALVPNLVDAPVLLSLAIALWVGGCLFVSLLDRTPASYMPMLAGYTAAIVGFPSVDAPGAIFDTAVSRAQEIILGILCASIFSSVILPQSVLPAVTARVDAWLAEARSRAFAALGGARATLEVRMARLNLSAEASAIDLLGSSLRYEPTEAQRGAGAVPLLRQHMMMAIPTSAAIVDRVDALRREGALRPEVEAVIARMRTWIAEGGDSRAEAEEMRSAVASIAPPVTPEAGWPVLLEASLAARLRDMIDLRQDIRELRRALAERRPPGPMAFRYTTRARTMRHYDLGSALHSAVCAAIAILISCAVWIGTAWPSGSTAPMMAAVACCFFATLDDPAPAIRAFAKWTAVSCVAVAFYLFAILPALSHFETLVIALAPALILCGLLMANPRTAPVGAALSANGATLLAIQERYDADFAGFVNSSIAMLAGMWIAVLTTRLIRSVSAEWVLRRLLRDNDSDLKAAAAGHGAEHGLELAALMLDRIALAAPRLAKLPRDEIEQLGDLIGDVRVGVNVVEVRRAHHAVGGEVRGIVDDALDRLAECGVHDASPDILRLIDRAIADLLRDRQGDAGSRLLMGLVGLRRGLFRDATGYGTTPKEIAA